MVAGGLGELVDPLLGDLDPVAVAEVLADERAQLVGAVDRACSHGAAAALARPACVRSSPAARALLRMTRRMPDLARPCTPRPSPDKLAVIDDRPGGDVRHASPTPSSRTRPTGWPTCSPTTASARATKVVWCGQNSIGVVDARSSPPASSASRPCRSTTGCPTRRRPTSPTTATPPSSYVDAEFAPMFERIRDGDPEGRATSSSSTAPAPDGHDRRRRARWPRRRPTPPPRCPTPTRPGRR